METHIDVERECLNWNKNKEECKYCERTVYEYDTGYSEYECLLGVDIMNSFYEGEHPRCPLSFGLSIITEEE